MVRHLSGPPATKEVIMVISGNRINNLIRLLGVTIIAIALGGCAAFTQPEPEPEPTQKSTGSLMRTYTIHDEQGRLSGTLIINPLGGVEFRDVDGNVVGKLKPQNPSPSVAIPKVDEEK